MERIKNNKLALACLLSLHLISKCASHDKVDPRALRAFRERDFFRSSVEVNGKDVLVFSYFNLIPHREVVGQALSPIYNSQVLDLRLLEEAVYCKAALKTLPPIKRYRGTLGFVAGIALTGIPYLYHRRAAHGTDK